MEDCLWFWEESEWLCIDYSYKDAEDVEYLSGGWMLQVRRAVWFVRDEFEDDIFHEFLFVSLSAGFVPYF